MGGERLELGGHPVPATAGKCTAGGQSQAVAVGVEEAARELEGEGPFHCTVRLSPAMHPLRHAAECHDAAAAHTRALRADRGRVRYRVRKYTPMVPTRTATGPPTRNDHGEGAMAAHHH